MKLTTQKYSLAVALASMMAFSSCINDLDQENPRNENVSNIQNEAVCNSFLSKIYSGFGMSGITGPAEENDLSASDGDQGSLVLLRGLLTMQEFPSDEVLWNWTDPGIVEIVTLNWDYTTKYAYTFYQRAMLNLRFCKEFLDQYPEDCGIADIKRKRDEVRAIRDLNYYFLIDLYGNPGVVWDNSPVNDKGWYPSQIGRTQLFDLVVNDLKEIESAGNLPQTASMATYAKMTIPVVQTILAKMYLNAEVYTGKPMYDLASQYCEKVMNAGFGLETDYRNLFCGENHLSPLHGNEIIFSIPFDETNAKSYGGVIMLSTAACGGALTGQWLGNNGAWTCMKTKESLIRKFDDSAEDGTDKYLSVSKEDKRYLFFDVLSYDKTGVEVEDVNWPFDPATGKILYSVKERRSSKSTLSDWDTGYLCYKFTNLTWDGGKTSATDFPNTDFPMFRLADIYLMYAECAVRGDGDMDKALSLVNELRDRAYLNKPTGRIQKSDLTLDFILDERARELYWEGHRRSDLIRFGKFTQGYVWPYKGGSLAGNANVSSKYNLYPFSDKDLTSNPNLVQNPGYKTVR